MTDWAELDVGSAPRAENCAQVGSDHYREQALAECRQYIGALQKKLGAPPAGCELRIKSNPHDFGTYYSVVARFDSQDRQAVDYAYRCESDGPRTWDEVGMAAPVLKPARHR